MRRVAAEVPAVYAAAMGRTEGGLRVVIAGGGPAGLEALLGLRDIAGGLVETTLVAPTAEFVYKPLLVDEPFGRDAAHFELRPFVEEAGGQFVRELVTAVDPAARHIHLGNGTTLEYDVLVVCIGARTRPAFHDALSFDAAARVHSVDDLVGPARSVAFVVPGGVTWSLPAYELALMTRRVGRSRDLRCTVVTPEPQPLALFGPAASEAVAQRLAQSGVECLTDSFARELDGGGFVLTPGDRPLDAERVVALPLLEGPALGGLPHDAEGFIPVDEWGGVVGADDVFAAGDGTTFPVKQGGLATQQADAVAEVIARQAGADVVPRPFRPVLRGKLLVGDESLYISNEVAGGRGAGVASLDYLWWPPHKIAGRYLSAHLSHTQPRADLEPQVRPLDVEVSLPGDWHSRPTG